MRYILSLQTVVFYKSTKAFSYGLPIETHRYEAGMKSNGL